MTLDNRAWAHIFSEIEKEKAAWDSVRPWQHYQPPALGAPLALIESAEARLGYGMDTHYRSFLSAADGWLGFDGLRNILGTADIGHGPLWSRQQETIRQALLEGDGKLMNQFGDSKALQLTSEELMPCIAGINPEISDCFLWISGPITDYGRPLLVVKGLTEMFRYDNLQNYLIRRPQELRSLR